MSATERWDAFLAQIEGRHRQVRDEALAAAQATIASLPGADVQPLMRAWAAVEARLQELESRIIDTWHEKVADAFAAEGLDGVRLGFYDQGDALKFALENEREALQVRIQSDAARQLFTRALQGRRDCFCAACGAQLGVPLVFRAVTLQCGRCGAAGVFEPGELLRGVAAVGAHALAQEAAWAQWLGMRGAERRWRLVRPPCPLPLLKDHERAQIAYWRAYVAARAQLEPELGRDPALEVRSRMEAWYHYTAEHEQEWVRAGRPRDAI
jgi:hypothetical protein